MTLAHGPAIGQRIAPVTQPPAAPDGPRHKCSNAVTRHDAPIAAIGTQIADHLVNTRNWQRLSGYIEDSNSDDERTAHVGMNVLFGCAMRLADVLAVGQGNNTFKVSVDIPTKTDVIYAFAIGRGRFVPLFEKMVIITRQVCDALPNLRITDPPKEQPAPAEPQTQKVEIVGLPDRLTTSMVERDRNGNIVKTTQAEVDA